ncbi:MAG: hypothetical protein ACFFD4_39665, partial [Candidatus Odinarchaeota archaeon]
NVFANPVWAPYMIPLFVITATVSVLIATAVVYGYVKFCRILLKVTPPENILPSTIIDIQFNKQVALTCHSYINIPHNERGAN